MNFKDPNADFGSHKFVSEIRHLTLNRENIPKQSDLAHWESKIRDHQINPDRIPSPVAGSIPIGNRFLRGAKSLAPTVPDNYEWFEDEDLEEEVIEETSKPKKNPRRKKDEKPKE